MHQVQCQVRVTLKVKLLRVRVSEVRDKRMDSKREKAGVAGLVIGFTGTRDRVEEPGLVSR